jgi:hypothetical protein
MEHTEKTENGNEGQESSNETNGGYNTYTERIRKIDRKLERLKKSRRKIRNRKSHAQDRIDESLQKIDDDIVESLPEETLKMLRPEENLSSKIEQLRREKIEAAKEVLGEANVFGPEEVAETFGFDESDVELPPMPYSAQELKEAKERGETLMLRMAETPDGEPLTIENMIGIVDGVFAEGSEIRDQTDWVDEAKKADNDEKEEVVFDFLDESTPNLEWKLVNTNKVEGAEHLSIEAQEAIANKNPGEAIDKKDETIRFWEENIVNPKEDNKQDLPDLPDDERLQEIIEEIPENASLPTLVEAIYDNLVYYQKNNEPIIPEERSVATPSTIGNLDIDTEEIKINEPERPWDIYFTDDGKVKIHSRRNMDMGRPGPLGDLESDVSISYIQH